MSLSIDLQGQTAIVTGVSSGIGGGVARVLAQAGATVIGCGKTLPESEDVQRLKREIEQFGGRLEYISTDVKDDAQLQRLVDFAVSVTGSIDIVVSNAGVNVFRGAAECSPDDWQHNFDLNLRSHWMLAKLARPHLRASKNGVFQIMTSNHAFASIPGCFPYNVAKTALTGLVRSLAIEWGPDVRVLGIAPGFIDTPGNDKWFNSFADPAAERGRTIAMHPAGKLGTTEEVGAFCAFLASPYAAFATGVTYVIDGGRTALLQDE